MEEVLGIELEALAATFAEDIGVEYPENGADTTVILSLAPRGVDSSDAFVTGKLQLCVPAGYPSISPTINVVDTKGIGDVRLQQLHERLRGEASTLAGEMVLGALCEHALDWMTEQNRPEGLCAFCLCPMEPQASPGAAGRAEGDGAQQLVRMPCFHAFHRGCYVSWWTWRQRALEAQERELVQHTGASAASVLREQDLPPREEDGSFATSCPVCRAPAPLDQLGPELRAQLSAARRAAGAVAAAAARPGSQARSRAAAVGAREGAGAVPEAEAEAAHSCPLSPGELAPYREVQARHAAVLARQRAAGGLIEAACYSIAGWTLGQGAEPAPQAPHGQAPAGPGPASGQAAESAPGHGRGARQRRRPGAGERVDARDAELHAGEAGSSDGPGGRESRRAQDGGGRQHQGGRGRGGDQVRRGGGGGAGRSGGGRMRQAGEATGPGPDGGGATAVADRAGHAASNTGSSAAHSGDSRGPRAGAAERGVSGVAAAAAKAAAGALRGEAHGQHDASVAAVTQRARHDADARHAPNQPAPNLQAAPVAPTADGPGDVGAGRTGNGAAGSRGHCGTGRSRGHRVKMEGGVHGGVGGSGGECMDAHPTEDGTGPRRIAAGEPHNRRGGRSGARASRGNKPDVSPPVY